MSRRTHQPYGSPMQPSSLGTPAQQPAGLLHPNGAKNAPPPQYQQPSQPRQGSSGPRGGPRSAGASGSWSRRQNAPMYKGDGEDPVFVPIRPLLKALAHECKPLPPWSVGAPPPHTLREELRQFAHFLALTPDERGKLDALTANALGVLQSVWPACEVITADLSAAGVFAPKDTVIHLVALHTETVPEEAEATIRAAAVNVGFQCEFFVDYRNCRCVMFTEARTGDRCVVRFGAEAAAVKASAETLRKVIAEVEPCRIALVVIEALLRQNKMMDETGSNPSLVPGEALAVMLVAIINSYGEDHPDCGRLLVDFFLTFGFQAHFDSAAMSVCMRGMASPMPKAHPGSQLSVVDPGNPNINLTPKSDKVVQLLATFNYCYTAMAQFEQVDQVHRRAQSALSTIIGGESYWSRVLQLYNQKIPPFYDVVRSKSQSLMNHR